MKIVTSFVFVVSFPLIFGLKIWLGYTETLFKSLVLIITHTILCTISHVCQQPHFQSTVQKTQTWPISMIPPSATSLLIPCVVNLNLYRKWLVLASHDSKRKVIEIDLHCATSIRRHRFSDQISGDTDSPNIDNHFILYLITPSSNKTKF